MELPAIPKFDVKDRNVLVTGASSGIGLGAACMLANEGAHVVCVARGKNALDDAVSSMRDKNWNVEGFSLDIADLEEVRAFINSRPCFDVLINSAGIARHTPALLTTPEDYDAVMNVNLRAAYFLSQFVATKMIEEEKKGSIVHISSQMGHIGGIDRAVYCATKWGIEGMIKAMSLEWGAKGIRINSVSPTFVNTPFAQKTLEDPEKAAWIMDKIKLGRLAEVQDVMGAILYLASDMSSMVTGTSIIIDGGWTAG